jgi:formate hydrogenlyase subunit 4
MVSLAENARVPVDNPATHLELTMIHEAMVLEYSGRHLAMIEWAASLKLFVYSCIGLVLFFPFGIARGGDWLGLVLALPALLAKLAVGGALLALIEMLSAKMRIWAGFLGTAFRCRAGDAGARAAGALKCAATLARSSCPYAPR